MDAEMGFNTHMAAVNTCWWKIYIILRTLNTHNIWYIFICIGIHDFLNTGIMDNYVDGYSAENPDYIDWHTTGMFLNMFMEQCVPLLTCEGDIVYNHIFMSV